MKVDFIDVGRDKKSWSAEYKVGDDFSQWWIRQIRKHGALMSRDIEFVCSNAEGSKVTILAGFRPVGTIVIHEEIAKTS